jgi:mRNA interferase RelE/StbE
VTGEPEDPAAGTSAPYAVIFSRQGRRNLHENVPLDVDVAAMAAIDGIITASPHRGGKAFDEPFDGYYSGTSPADR